jgi:uncharacterized protein
MGKQTIILAIALLLALPMVCSADTPQAPTISSYVTDNANVFSPGQKSMLEQELRNLQNSTNQVQFIIFTEKNIPEGTTLEERSLKIAEDNKVGKKGADNGILFYLATEDRAYRWEVGYGVEDVLSAPLLGRLSRGFMVPYFQQGKYAEGIITGTGLVEKILMNVTDADVNKVMAPEQSNDSAALPIIFCIAIILIFVIIAVIKNSNSKVTKGKKSFGNNVYHGAAGGLFMGNMGSGGFGRGGFGGGGFSGGGGSFGGGGFSGGF